MSAVRTSSDIFPIPTASICRPCLARLATRPNARHARFVSAFTSQLAPEWRNDTRPRQSWPEPRATTNATPLKRAFSTSQLRQRDHHFDTLKFVQRLREEGFNEAQSVAMMRVLSDVVEESIQNLTRTLVLREDQEKSTYTQKVDFAKLRSELLAADTSESSATRASHERLTNELAKLNSKLRDDINRTQASVRLDLNLEKGRIREEANSQELKIKEVETRIEQETATLRERLEQVKFTTLQWLMYVDVPRGQMTLD